MRFKLWLQKESVVGTAVLHGGVGESPTDSINTGLPVRSKTSCVDGSPPQQEKTKKKPEKIFGFDLKQRRKERSSKSLDTKDRFPVVDINPSDTSLSP